MQSSGHHVALRGHQRIGKRTLLRGAFADVCERTGGAAFFVELAPAESAEALQKQVAERVDAFLKQAASGEELRSNPKEPFQVLGDLSAPFFVGLDGLGALKNDTARQVCDALFATPKNVRLSIIAPLHYQMEAMFRSQLLPRIQRSVLLGPIADEELVTLINTPAAAHGAPFADESLGALAEASGSRPYELLTLAALATAELPQDFRGNIPPERIDELISVDALAKSPLGQELVEGYLHLLAVELSPTERRVLEMIATGVEGDAPTEELERLEVSGLIQVAENGVSMTSACFESIVRAVASGEISIAVDDAS